MADGAHLARQWLQSSPFVGELGLRLVELEPDRAEVTMPFRPSLATIGDLVHGGAVASLVDTAATAAAWSTPEPPESLRGTTVQMSLTFVAPARGTDVVARARVVRRGRNLCFCEVDVADDLGQVVAKALVTYKLG